MSAEPKHVALPSTLQPGATFAGRYTVVRCFSAGGMGAVYEVTHTETRRRLALKVMLPSLVADDDMRARFKLEATIAAEIDSDHIVHVYDAGVDIETAIPFIVMELLKGEELGATLARRGRLPADEVVMLLRQAALALDKTHAAGIVHRDLKPENLFLTRRDDGTAHLKVLDFGIAKIIAQSGAKATRSMGTPLYMSPEQIGGDGTIGPASDRYAIGHIAFSLLVGHGYWEEEARATEAVYALLARVVRGSEEGPRARAGRSGVELPEAFDSWFKRATAVDPNDRFSSSASAVEALAESLGLASTNLSRRIGPGEEAAPPQPKPTNEAVVPTSGTMPSGDVADRRRSASAGSWRTTEAVSSDSAMPVVPRSRLGPVLLAGSVVVLAAGLYVGTRTPGAAPLPASAQGLVASEIPLPSSEAPRTEEPVKLDEPKSVSPSAVSDKPAPTATTTARPRDQRAKPKASASPGATATADVTSALPLRGKPEHDPLADP